MTTSAPGAGWRNDPAWPDVDVVMPIRNEAAHLESAIASVRAQEYPGRLHIILGVGPSDDGTEALARRLADESEDLVVVANPSGRTPAGLNAAIAAGDAPVVVRVDGHSVLPEGYVRRAIEQLRSTGAANVGGRQVSLPETPFEEAVATATTSWLGTGGASYRVGGEPGPVDTVYLGVFDRSAIESVGLFDERLIRNQDYELNIRLREAGHRVWFDPELWVGHRPRGSWRALARQYWEYGYWKAQVLRLHPSSLRVRQAVPPVAIGSVVAAALAAPRVRIAGLLPLSYFLVVATTMRRRWRAAAAVFVLHGAWATGVMVGSIRPNALG